MPLATITSSSTSSRRMNLSQETKLKLVVIAEPRNEAGEPVFERRVGMKAHGGVQRADVRIGLRHVAGLHRLELLHGGAAQEALERGNEVRQGDGAVVPHVI